MVLADPALKTSSALDAESGIYFFLFIIAFIAILALIFDPRGVAAVAAPVAGSLLSPFIAIVKGVYTFIVSFFTGLLNHLLGGVTGLGSSIYNNTIGRI